MSRGNGARRTATPELLELVARRFRALAEPARLTILHALEEGELTVTELVERTGMGQGNLSKHLQQLHAGQFVSRRRHGLFVHYALADENVLHLCELMCGRLESEADSVQRVVNGRRSARTGAASKAPTAKGSASRSQAPGATPRKSRFSST
jgi:DNA-binding transcriptional ArsR family regulator